MNGTTRLPVVAAFAVWFAASVPASAQSTVAGSPSVTTLAADTAERNNPPERGAVPLNRFGGNYANKHKHHKHPAAHAILPQGISLDRYLSLLVTDVDTVSQLKFSEVMGQLAAQSGQPGLTKELLFQQWWDTANPSPGFNLGPHCNDVPPTDPTHQFPYQCVSPSSPNGRKQDGSQAAAAAEVFAGEASGDASAYSAIAVSNRFDLLSDYDRRLIKYPDCGEFRVIFARNSGRTTIANGRVTPGNLNKRVLISFEARIPNPDNQEEYPNEIPPLCQDIIAFWYRLSDPSLSGIERGKKIHDFFMLGKLDDYGGALPHPVIYIGHFTALTGQIRTNQFLNDVTTTTTTTQTGYGPPAAQTSTTILPQDWLLREFRMDVQGNHLLIVPATVKSTPGSVLFANPPTAGAQDPRLSALTSSIPKQLPGLLGGRVGNTFPNLSSVNSIQFTVPNVRADAYESDEHNQSSGDIFAVYSSNPNSAVENAIKQGSKASGIPALIRDTNLVDRMRTQTCAGCHQYSDTIKKVGTDIFGFDDPGALGGGAVWPSKACGDYDDCGTTPATQSLFTLPHVTTHPPMQFTQVTELILTPSEADKGARWRYAISSTVECFLDFREKFMNDAVGHPPTSANHCPTPIEFPPP